MRLRSIKLKNFQAHKEVEIPLKNITTIQGPTDTGKSSILRALRWICLNDISGDEFVTEGEKKVVVTLDIVCGKIKHQIRRIRQRGGSVNTYELDGEEFKSFGSTVPAPIAQILRLNEINFQGQHDTPYWFSETAGEVSRRLNTVIDLSVIDSSLSNIASMVRQAAERKNLCEERLGESTAQLAEVKGQEARIDEFKALEKIDTEAKNCEEEYLRLIEMISLIKDNQAKQLEEQVKAVEGVFSVARTSLKFARRADALEGLIDEILQHRAIRLPPPFDPINEAFENCEEIRKREVDLDSLLQRIYGADFAKDATEAAAEAAEQRFHQEVKDTKCPLCGQLIL